MPLCCTNQSGTKPNQVLLQGTKHDDVIFNYIIIEMASSDNPSVRITISEGPLYFCKHFPFKHVLTNSPELTAGPAFPRAKAPLAQAVLRGVVGRRGKHVCHVVGG